MSSPSYRWEVPPILRRGGEVLLGRRVNTGYADGLLHAPSGRAEDGEDVRQAVIREAREETGLHLAPGDLRVALVMQHRAPYGQPRIGWFFEAGYGAGGEPVNREPDKCSELDWFPLAALRATWSRTAGPASRPTARAAGPSFTGTGRATRSA
jgi:8-oxo-dGTP pyrophosphatase MutT (NUDIX family)